MSLEPPVLGSCVVGAMVLVVAGTVVGVVTGASDAKVTWTPEPGTELIASADGVQHTRAVYCSPSTNAESVTV